MTKQEGKTLNGLLHRLLELRDRRCLRCGKVPFQMSHIYPKGRYRSMKHEPDNVKALCFACHLGWFHKNPLEAGEWLKTALPAKRLARLRLMSRSYKAPPFEIRKLELQQLIAAFPTPTSLPRKKSAGRLIPRSPAKNEQ